MLPMKSPIILAKVLFPHKRSVIYYIRKIFWKTDISSPPICTHTYNTSPNACAYQVVRNVSFWENFAHLLIARSLTPIYLKVIIV